MVCSFDSLNLTPGSTCYYRIYLSKSEIMIYSLDYYYRVIASRNISLSQVDFAGVSKKDISGLELSEENLIVSIKKNEKTESLLYYFIPERDNKEEMKKFYNLLIENGVRSFVTNKLSPAVFLAYFVSIFTAIYCIYTLIN